MLRRMLIRTKVKLTQTFYWNENDEDSPNTFAEFTSLPIFFNSQKLIFQELLHDFYNPFNLDQDNSYHQDVLFPCFAQPYWKFLNSVSFIK